MKKTIIAVCALIVSFTIAYAELTVEQIISKAYNLEDGNDYTATINMKIVRPVGTPRERDLQFFRKDFGADSRSLIKFNSPADVRGTSFLTWNNKNRDNDQWLFLPALNKVRRIAAGSKSQSFMGSHFSYEDMGNRSMSMDTFKITGSQPVDNSDCYVVEALAKNKSEKYVKRVMSIRKDNFIIVRSDLFDSSGALVKRYTAKNIKQINGIWTILSLKMEDLKEKGYSTLDFSNIQYNTGLSERLFRVEALQ